MITELQASGFRSLDDFSMEIRPGLNVLVGPNGGGKTNILALISFLSALTSNELSDAINSSGGVSKVFQKLSGGSFVKHLKCSVEGKLPFSKQYYIPANYARKLMDDGFQGIKYRWEFEIDASRGFDDTYYRSQTLYVTALTSSLVEPRDDEWDLVFHAHAIDDQNFEIIADVINHDHFSILYAGDLEESENLSQNDIVESSDQSDLSSTAIFFLLRKFPTLRWIGLDLRSGTTFNFDPSVCKSQNDSAHPPSLGANGSGLAATLFAIDKATTAQRPQSYFISSRHRFPRGISTRLNEYFCLINEAIIGYHAKNDPMSNKITIHINIEGNEKTLDFPIEFASDGTVKWLAFLTALLTEKSGFALEEPENFLHPDIQRQAVELVRAETEGHENLCVLMTTHSESLLNATRPEEIIIVSMNNGITSSKRVDDAELIDAEIYESGFGLGYFYISGALNG